mmetsp:Transcript_10457/g.30365  ORF Transcript_10457/g.30365 Transcript_10457/m.30365 type:complete len:499 (-) Transcript_10457:173-1669(-)
MLDEAVIRLLGWQSFLGARSLGGLRAASIQHREETHAYLVSSLCEIVSDKRQPPLKELLALAKCASRGDVNAINAVASRLEGKDPSVHRAALSALRCLADRGNATALRAIDAHLVSDDLGARSAALAALGLMARRGDRSIISKVVRRLSDNDLVVRMKAAQVLRQVAEKGDPLLIDELLPGLWGADDGAREATEIAFHQAAGRSDANTALKLKTALLNEPACVSETAARRAILRALVHVGSEGEARAIAAEAVTSALASSVARRVAVEALGELADFDDERARRALRHLLFEDGDPTVRRAVVVALERLQTAPGQPRPLSGGSASSSPPSSAAGRTDGRGGAGDLEIVESLEGALRDRDAGVRVAAVLGLGRAIGAEHRNGIAEKVAARFEDTDQSVRTATVDAAGRLIQKGNLGMVAEALRMLRKGHKDVEFALDRLPDNLRWLRTSRWLPEGRGRRQSLSRRRRLGDTSEEEERLRPGGGAAKDLMRLPSPGGRLPA